MLTDRLLRFALREHVEGLIQGLLQEQAGAAKRDCAVCKALAGVGMIALEAKLAQHAVGLNCVQHLSCRA